MNEVRLIIHPFEMGTDRESALKPLEEAAEVFGAWQREETYEPPISSSHKGVFAVSDTMYEDLADEIADCVQACVNLAERYGIDLPAAIERCEKRNRDRGRYGTQEVEPMGDDVKCVFDRLMNDSTGDGR